MTDTQTPLRANGYVDAFAFDGTNIWVFRGKRHLETIPLGAVDAINIRPATRLVNGVAELVHGDRARAVVFTWGHRREFATFSQVVLEARARLPPAHGPVAAPGQPLVAYGIQGQAVTFDGYNLAVFVGDRLVQEVVPGQLASISVTPIRPVGGNLTIVVRGGGRFVVGFQAVDRPAHARIVEAVQYGPINPQPAAALPSGGVDPWTASSLPVAAAAPVPVRQQQPVGYNAAGGLSPQGARTLRRLLTLSMWTEGIGLVLLILVPLAVVAGVCGWTLLR